MQKNIKAIGIVCFVLLLCMSFVFAACEVTPTEVEITKITLDKDTLSMKVGDEATLTATVEPVEQAANERTTASAARASTNSLKVCFMMISFFGGRRKDGFRRMMGPIWCRWKILIVFYYVMMRLSIFTRHFRCGFSVPSGGEIGRILPFFCFSSVLFTARSFSCFFCMNFMFPLDKPLFRVYNRSAWKNTPTGYIKPLQMP